MRQKMVLNHNIKRGVSLFSFQEEYFLRKMTLEDLIATAQELDIPGIEIIGEQMIPGYPRVSASFFDQWHGWMEKYGRIPICLDMILEWDRYKGRVMTEDEMAASVVEDIKVAHKLGCGIVRIMHGISPELMERLAPYAEEYGVKLALEIRAPSHFDHEYEQRLIETFQRVGSPSLGFTLDLGIYTKRFPRVISGYWIRKGMKEEIADHIVNAYHNKAMDNLEEEVVQIGGTADDVNEAVSAKRNVYTDPRRMLDFMPYIFHVHGKVMEMLPDYTDYSIPYEEIIPVMIEGGYNGYIASEYEGNMFLQDAFVVDSVEQVRRHQVMLKRFLDEA
jgi:sugar phosphate isomerase/epimerase